MPAPVLVIIPYFGTFGRWFPLYLHSLSRQSTLDLLLVTDAPTPPLPPNVRRVEMSIENVRDLATHKLGTPVALSGTRKFCDLKPAYGVIFEDYTNGYDYWAFGDEDVLYGDLDKFLSPRLIAKPDVLTAGRTGTVGHLTLLRNSPQTAALVLGDPLYREVLMDPDYWAYDEWGWAQDPYVGSFTEFVRKGEGAGKIVVSWGLPKCGDFPASGRSYTYRGGALKDNEGTEFAYYHWGRYRGKGYAFPSFEEAADGFEFDRYGFYGFDESPLRALVRRSTSYAQHVRGAVGHRIRRHAYRVLPRP
jgi:hypothetical protein